MITLACYSIKGGVGKTATAVNLAYQAVAEHDAAVLLWDLDPQAAATFYFRIAPKIRGSGKKLIDGRRALEDQIKGTDYEGLDLLPGDFSYRNLDLALDQVRKPKIRLAKLLSPLARQYDCLFLDCAPSISIVSEAIFRAADALLVPVIPTPLSLRTVEQLASHLAKKELGHVPVLPFYCMVDRRKKLHREVCENREIGPYRMLDTAIPYSTWVERMGIHRTPVAEFASSTPAASSYQELWREVWRLLRDRR